MQQGQEYPESTEHTGVQRYSLVDDLLLPIVKAIPTPASNKFLARVQRFLVGHVTAANIAGSIEGPLRLAPQQRYTIRIRITGRDSAASEHGGLSSLVCGDEINIVIYSALDERYTRLMREIVVAIPAEGSFLEVTVPLIAIDDTYYWHRERIQVYFLDSHNQQLYERPFAFDLTISPRVTPGKEGYVAVTIPL
ncbi:MAG TPA: hypothetical protein VL485_13760 [Ktedonobacteraceae bacterium]|nr:hypothetical protein [Ktedonobacteraceae bacterium]